MRRAPQSLVATLAVVVSLAVVPTAPARPWPAAKTPAAVGLEGGAATVDAQGTHHHRPADPRQPPRPRASLPEAIAAPRLSQRNAATTQSEAAPLQTPRQAALEARGQVLKPTTDPPSAQHIGAATGIELVGRGLILAAAEPFRRGGGSALVARPAGTPNR